MRDRNERNHAARAFAEQVLKSEESAPGARAAAEIVLEYTEPLTMADTEWYDNKHRLAGATTLTGRDVVMLWHDDESEHQIICDNDAYRADCLTPNEKRYELREIVVTKETAHPAILETLGDYESAPEGTIVATSGTAMIWRKTGGRWKHGDYRIADNTEMEGVPRDVLRWVWGA